MTLKMVRVLQGVYDVASVYNGYHTSEGTRMAQALLMGISEVLDVNTNTDEEYKYYSRMISHGKMEVI